MYNYSEMAMTVADLNKYIKNKFETDEFLQNVLIKGEISNFKHHYTGHFYFTLKDENALIKCVMFKSYADKMTFEPKDGDKVIVLGSCEVFVRDGVYQIYAKAIKKEGTGDLHEKFEELKAKLEKEGLFDSSHKKQIPFMPKSIGVLTASTGAVIRDIINVSTRRNPNVYIKLLPVPVQGEGASIKIANAIEIMNKEKLCDVLIIGRGGGSLEDLWPFNEEIVARAIYNSEIPIISAVGHETDFTIADFVADLRAPTPSAAAELAVQNIEDIEYTIKRNTERLRHGLLKQVEIGGMRLDNKVVKLERAIQEIVNNNRTKLVREIARIDTLSPLKTMTRGYMVTLKDGNVIKSEKDLNKDDKITLRFIDGSKEAKVL